MEYKVVSMYIVLRAYHGNNNNNNKQQQNNKANHDGNYFLYGFEWQSLPTFGGRNGYSAGKLISIRKAPLLYGAFSWGARKEAEEGGEKGVNAHANLLAKSQESRWNHLQARWAQSISVHWKDLSECPGKPFEYPTFAIPSAPTEK